MFLKVCLSGEALESKYASKVEEEVIGTESMSKLLMFAQYCPKLPRSPSKRGWRSLL